MEVLILLLIMVIIGTLFFALLPYLLPLFLILFLYSLYRSYVMRKKYRDYFEGQQHTDASDPYNEQRSQSGDSDVIDVEYSEETIDHEE